MKLQVEMDISIPQYLVLAVLMEGGFHLLSCIKGGTCNRWMQGGPAAVYGISESGWMASDNFCHGLRNCFVSCITFNKRSTNATFS